MSNPVGFAVVITNYNYRQFVAEAVDGALAQTRAAAQVIVVDDGSTDGSPQLLRERYGSDARVTLLLGENGGQLAAFVRGLRAATAEVICFLDADDRWDPEYLAKIGEIYDTRRDIDFVFSDVALFGNEQGVQGYAKDATDLGYTAISTWATGHWYGEATSALSMRRHWAVRALDLPADFVSSWRISADNCLVFGSSVLGARKFYLPTGAVHYRIHDTNGWWHARDRERQFASGFRSRCLINYYASRMYMDDHVFDLVKREFLSKPAPAHDEIWRYAALALRGPSSWFKRVERAVAIARRAFGASSGKSTQ
ncbi:glycosyltransferase family 2 protein [Rhodanobacter sp. L36]|uniref:glycosyltransferase family 2 protein n=1 Tax=Rhodanobacter sp. L36 TaxID=1747221 RepID=UPI00131DF7E4|nr:glycosyltransferase family 2 protein [Rhodanobacter sp. L36]